MTVPKAPTKERWYSNPAARQWTSHPNPSTDQADAGQVQVLSPSPLSFHRTFPTYHPTPLLPLPEIATELGLAQVYVKDESARLDLPAFKILGASWAIALTLCELLQLDPRTITFTTLKDHVAACRLDHTLVAATDGNHGRAVARMAQLLGLPAIVFVPASVTTPSRNFIASEGATVEVVQGSYDAAVSTAASFAAEDTAGRLLIQDTSWEGYDIIPAQIVKGYTTLFAEVDEEMSRNHLPSPSLVCVPVGVGSLAHAAILHHRSPSRQSRSAILTVEPINAPCLLTSLLAGQLTSITTTDTIMPGLNCGTPSPEAWPDLQAGVDAAVSVTDDQAVKALHRLKALGVRAGPCGAATLAGLMETLTGEGAEGRRSALGIDENSVVVLISTEGPEVFFGTQ